MRLRKWWKSAGIISLVVVAASGSITRPVPAQEDIRAKAPEFQTLERKALLAARAEAALDAIAVHNLDDIRGNILLRATSDGLPITWHSSLPEVISTDGRIQRQAVDVDVTLTATVDTSDVRRERVLHAVVRRAVAPAPLEGYAFAYFTGNSRAGENIFFAASDGNNALRWRELNGGKAALSSSKGTKGLRDPFIIRSPEGDTFYLVATDLSIGSGTSWAASARTGSRYLEVWESHDLKAWSAQRHVLVSPPTAGNTWAPEAYYDTDLGAYVVFWASSLYAESDASHTGSTYHRMMYATTRDFVTFSDPQVWQDAGTSRIDSTVIKADGVYYRFTKDEGAGGTGCSDIIQERSSSLRATLKSWTVVDTCIGRDAGTKAVEGPTAFRANPGDVNGAKYYLFVDEYGGRGYVPLETTDISKPQWKVSSGYTLPKSPRHGTVIPITAAELASLASVGATSRAPSSAAVRSTAQEVAPLAASGARGDLADAADYTPALHSRAGTARRATEAAEMRSPALPGLYADPNMAVFNKTYYIFATTDGFPGWGGKAFYAWKSPNLADWTRGARPFLTLDGAAGDVPWASGSAWAPTIAERGGRYYFYFSGHNVALNRKTIGVAVSSSSSPEGPFVAQPAPLILNSEAVTTGQAIDPAAFADPATGKHYLFWGNGAPLFAELADDMVSLKAGTTRKIAGLTDFREGLFPFFRKGLYHLTYSVDDTRSEDYRVGYATATSVTGPWTYRGIVLQKDPSRGILGTGHDSVVNVPGTDDWYMAYHRFAIPGGNGTNRETTIDVVRFDEGSGFMLKVVPTLTSVAPQPVP